MIEIYFDGTLIDSDNYISLTNDFKQFDSSFMLGTTASNTITMEVPSTIPIPTDVLIKINNKDYATMIVDSYEYEDNEILKLNLVDKMVLLNIRYDASSIVPCTVKDILEDICTVSGIELSPTTFINENVQVNFYDNTISARDYLGMIAELNGGFARINPSGKLELVKFKGTPTNIDIETCENFIVGANHTIERVVFDNGLIKYETSSNENLETLYLNSENVFINDETTFNNIANEILGFNFYNFTTGNCEINSDIKAGDLINFTDENFNYKSIAQYSLNYVGGLNGGYELDINSERQEETKIEGTRDVIKSIKVRLNRDENTLTTTITEVGELKQITTQVQQTADSINAIVNSQGERISTAEATLKDDSLTLNLIRQNIDPITGIPSQVKTGTGFTFDNNGLNIADITENDGNTNIGFNVQIKPTGTFYKDSNKVVAEYTKDGSKQKDLTLFGVYKYGLENIEDNPMFIAQLYTDEEGEEVFGHFYNGD